MSSSAAPVWGPEFWGIMVNVFLFGIAVTQAFLYFIVYKQDRLWMKVVVWLVMLCDAVETVATAAYGYNRLVVNFGDFDKLNLANWEVAIHPIFTAMIAIVVQLFYAWRILRLTESWLLVLVIVLCAIVSWCGSVGTGIAAAIVKEITQFQRFEVIVIICNLSSALTDTIIAVSITWYLQKHKTGVPHTDHTINRIIRLTVQSGTIPALCALVDLIIYMVVPTGALYLFFNDILPKLYTNSLLSSLNSRAGWGNELRNAPLPSGPLVTPHFRSSGGMQTSGFSREVFINVETIQMTEVGERKVVNEPLSPNSDDGESIARAV